jgi:AcrR family transcriptional regulator
MNVEVSFSMPDPPFGRTGRARSKQAKQPLSLERIIDAAFSVMAAEGYEALTMRRLATELGTGPASLYAHVDNKQELDSLIIDRVARDLHVPEPDPRHWQEQVKQMLRDVWEGLNRHPGLARAVIANIPTGSEALRVSEGLLAILQSGGIAEQVAAWACDLLPMYVTAVCFEESVYARMAAGVPAEETAAQVASQLHDYFSALPRDRFPHIVASAAALTAGDGGDRFEFGLSVLLAGIQAVSDSWPAQSQPACM